MLLRLLYFSFLILCCSPDAYSLFRCGQSVSLPTSKTGLALDSYATRIIRPWEIGCNEFLHSVAVDHAGRVFTVTPDVQKIFWFDGNEWKSEDLTSVPRKVFADEQGAIWLCTSDGVWRVSFNEIGKIQVAFQPIVFEEGQDKTLLFATMESQGRFLFNHHVRVQLRPGAMVAEPSPEGYSWVDTNARQSLLVSKDKGSELFRMGDNETPVPLLSNGKIAFQSAFFYDRNVVIGWTVDGKIFRVENGKAKTCFQAVQEKIGKCRVYSMRRLANGNVGIASSKGFFECTLDGEIQTILDSRDGLEKDIVFCCFQDSHTLWLTCGKSLARLDKRHDGWGGYLTDGASRVHDFEFDGSSFYFSTDNGCHVLRLDGVDSKISNVEGVANPTYSIQDSSQGRVVAATTSGLFYLDGEVSELIHSGRFYALLEKHGVFLSSNHQGTVLIIDPRNEDIIVKQGPTLPFEVRYLYDVDSEYLLVAGWNGNWELMKFDGQNCELARHRHSANLICPIQSIYGDGFLFENGIWLESEMNDAMGRQPTSGYEILNRWLSGKPITSLLQVSSSRWVAVTPSRMVLLQVKNNRVLEVGHWYLAGKGRVFAEYDSSSNRVVCVNDDQLFVVNLDQVESRQPDLAAPLVHGHINEAELVSDSDGILLKSRGGLKFSFSVPSNQVPNREILYQHRLLGFSNEWTDWSHHQQKEYTNLAGGNYEFQARAGLGSDTYSETSSIKFVVRTPWYATWPALFSFSFAGLFLVIGVVRLRSRHLEKSNLKMEKIVQERTHELEVQRERVKEKSDLLLQQNRQSEVDRLESLSRTMGAIAHDFNNLLQVVLVNCELLEFQVDNESMPFVKAIKGAQSSAAELCSQLQAFTGKMPCIQEYVDLNEEVRKGQKVLSASFSDNTQLSFQFADLTAKVFLETVGFQQILLNLLFNARDAGGKEIEIRTEEGFLTADDILHARAFAPGCEPGNFLWVQVSDNGKGIEEDTLGNIFDPFFSTKGLGRGLGLSVVRRVVRRNRGVLFVESKTTGNTGTIFRIGFPAEEQTIQNSLAAEERGLVSPSCRPLVAVLDDEISVLEGLIAGLQANGYETFKACTPTELYEFLANGAQPAVVLIDVSMPLERGDSVAINLRKSGYDNLIFLMSGFSEDSISTGLLQDSRVHFLRKPFSAQELSKQIDLEVSQLELLPDPHFQKKRHFQKELSRLKRS